MTLATVSTASDLLHQRLCLPHRIYSTDDHIHRTGSTPPMIAPTAPDLLHRWPHPPHRISITYSLVRLTWNAQPLLPHPSPSSTPPQRGRYSSPIPRCNVFYCWMLLICWYLAPWISWLRFNFCLCIGSSSFYRHTPCIVMSCVCVPGSS
jgi:hypothetical protein